MSQYSVSFEVLNSKLLSFSIFWTRRIIISKQKTPYVNMKCRTWISRFLVAIAWSMFMGSFAGNWVTSVRADDFLSVSMKSSTSTETAPTCNLPNQTGFPCMHINRCPALHQLIMSQVNKPSPEVGQLLASLKCNGSVNMQLLRWRNFLKTKLLLRTMCIAALMLPTSNKP